MFKPDWVGAIFDDDDGEDWTSGATLPHAVICQFAVAKKIVSYTLTPHAQAIAPEELSVSGVKRRRHVDGYRFQRRGIMARLSDEEDVRGEHSSGYLDYYHPTLHIFKLWGALGLRHLMRWS